MKQKTKRNDYYDKIIYRMGKRLLKAGLLTPQLRNAFYHTKRFKRAKYRHKPENWKR